ncbi:hypothetical protein LCGC14_0396430 [marine sediment metagenome]|uniref:HNH nuclease domain-containing protein n=1 Tax=marine sediment metagenome TaxID=412755 RepID=A0A0F9VK23_9ZZZZ
MDKLEKIARLLCGQRLKDDFDSEYVTDQDRSLYRQQAQEILQAILSDPTITYTPPIGNPQLGDIKTNRELARGVNPSVKKVWSECEVCHKPRWVMLVHGKPQRAICRACSKDNKDSNNPRWKGGRAKIGGGYIGILNHGHPDANNKGYVPEHRLVLEAKLGRPLKLNECAHHLNGVKTDNRPENLVAVSPQEHNILHHLKGAIKMNCPKCDEELKNCVEIDPDAELPTTPQRYTERYLTDPNYNRAWRDCYWWFRKQMAGWVKKK